MKKIYTILTLALATAWLPAMADDANVVAMEEIAASGLQMPQAIASRTSDMTAQNNFDLITPAETVTGRTARSARAKAITSTADLDGDYVMTYKTLITSGYDGGCSVSVAAISGTDSVAISGIAGQDSIVNAKVDITNMTITIPSQVVAYNSTYGEVIIAYCTSSGTMDTSTEITGTISSDGTITISSWWGLYVASGDYAGGYFGLYYGTTLEPANATMSYDVYESGDTVTYTCGVIVEQTSTSTLSVKGFYNLGQTISIELRSDHSAEIPVQTVTTNSYGDWKCHAAVYGSSYSSISMGMTIICDVASDLRTISWGDWNLFIQYSTGLYYYTEILIGGTITTTADISYPTAATLEGDGTQSSPYLIASAADWNTLATEYMAIPGDSLTGKYVKLTADIDFTDTEIKALGYDGNTMFNGDLDGNGKTIKGISATLPSLYYGGLITQAYTESSIHDLTIEGTLETSFSYNGGVVGVTYGTVSNVTSKLTINHTSSKYSYVGGIIGYVYMGTVTGCTFEGTITSSYTYSAGIAAYFYAGTMSDCVNKGTVSGTSYVAGITSIIGYSTITNCYNEGAVEGSTAYIGGVMAYSNRDMVVTGCYNTGTVTNTGTTTAGNTAGVMAYCLNGTFTDCYNTGTVSATSSSVGYLAGIVAYEYGYSSGTCVFVRCYNTADITASYYTAGLIAYSSIYGYTTMTDCYNTGNITSTTANTSGSYTAGIAAYCNTKSTYTGCYNTGNITSPGKYTGGIFGYYRGTYGSAARAYINNCFNYGNVTSSNGRVGGIISYATKYTHITGCGNTGDVSGTQYIGGIVGQLVGSKYSSIHDSYNSGNITGDSTYVGGIVGYNSYRDTIDCCFNTGDVTASGYAGGIEGYACGAMSNVYNTGNITAKTFVGGIGGCAKSGSYTKITTAYSTGTITASEQSFYGNILGTGTNSTYWGSANSMSDTYYLTANGVDEGAESDTICTGLSYAELAKLDLGDDWTAGDNYTYPRLTTLADNDYAKAHAAAVIPADGDSYSSITQGFSVGTPDSVTWSASPAVVEFNGNTATFTESYSGELILTATCGDATATTTLTVNGVTVGISSIGSDTAREVVSEKFYTASGTQVAEPEDGARAIYIVVKTYDDGTTEAVKEIR